MNCPACKNSLIILELNQIEIDYCTNCKGIWFDKGELELIHSEEVRNDLKDLFREELNSTEQIIKCPICKMKMKKFQFDQSGIIIDNCSDHGFWFENGELKSLLRRTEKQDTPIIKILNDIFGN